MTIDGSTLLLLVQRFFTTAFFIFGTWAFIKYIRKGA
jgi:hypothetical protein